MAGHSAVAGFFEYGMTEVGDGALLGGGVVLAMSAKVGKESVLRPGTVVMQEEEILGGVWEGNPAQGVRRARRRQGAVLGVANPKLFKEGTSVQLGVVSGKISNPTKFLPREKTRRVNEVAIPVRGIVGQKHETNRVNALVGVGVAVPVGLCV